MSDELMINDWKSWFEWLNRVTLHSIQWGTVRSSFITLVFVASQLNTQHKGEKNKDWLARNQDNGSW